MKLKEEKGLTLVELLATLVILAIIATIAVLSIGQIIKNSQEKAIIADAVKVIEAAKLAEASGDVYVNIHNEVIYTLDDLSEYLSGSSDKIYKNLGEKPLAPTIQLITDGKEKGTFEIGVRTTHAKITKIKDTSKYYPGKGFNYKEEALKRALEGKGQENKN